jgi:hypothetical protein
MNIVATTTKMDVNVPTDEYFAIPAVDIFWGCGQNYILPPPFLLLTHRSKRLI